MLFVVKVTGKEACLPRRVKASPT